MNHERKKNAHPQIALGMKGIFFVTLLLCSLAFPSHPLQALQLEGVVLSEHGPVTDAVVTAYPDYEALLQKRDGVRSLPGEKPGQYRLTLEEGSYYLEAVGSENGLPLYGYHGLNPLQIREAYRWVPIMALPVMHPSCEPGFQGLGGRILYKGRPVPGSSVSIYTLEEEPFRGMGLLTNTVPEDGSFWFDLDPGTYVLIARRRQGGGAIGPIRKGDLLCYAAANPLQVFPGESCVVDIPCYPRDDIDAFFAGDATDPRGKKEQKRRSASLREADETSSTRVIGGEGKPAFLSGRVTTLEGLPLEGLYISAYPADEVPLFQMYVLRMKTEYMTRTDRKGFFRLNLTGGTYYLVARERVGDAPVAGEYYGIYEGSPNHSITLAPDEIKTGVHIVAESIMP
ncbi:MAG: hypothetical protein Kow0089_19460 [Desulfobulbaceae bacterium]